MNCHICNSLLQPFSYCDDNYLKCLNCTDKFFFKCAFKIKEDNILGYILYHPIEKIFIASCSINNETCLYNEDYPIATAFFYIKKYIYVSKESFFQEAFSKIKIFTIMS